MHGSFATARVLAILVALLLGAPIARADLTAVEIGIGGWSADPSGDVAFDGDMIDLADDLNLDRATNAMATLTLDHPVPGLPDVRLNYTTLTLDGRSTLNRPIEFGDQLFIGGEEVATEADFDTIDLVVYYGLPVPVVALDVGVAARWFDGAVELRSVDSGISETAELTGVVPLGYARAELPLPFGFGAEGEVTGLSVGDNKVLDYQLALRYELTAAFIARATLGARLGYRVQDYDLDDIDDLEAAVEFDGAFAMVYFRASLF